MAIVGSLVAHSFTGRWQARRRYIIAPSRGCSMAGYAAINVAALLTACELGIQPLFFKDASGAPLYAPYPLHIAIPAMMIGHLTFAGLAELFVPAEWLHICNGRIQRCWARAPHARLMGHPSHAPGWGQLARSGLAWLCSCAAPRWGLSPRGRPGGNGRRTISPHPSAAADRGCLGQRCASDPSRAGLARLSTLWSAPFPQYAPLILAAGPLSVT